MPKLAYLTKFFALSLLLLALYACGGVAPESKAPAVTQQAKAQSVRFGFPVEQLHQKTDCYELKASYPFIGRPALDQPLRLWVDTVYNDARDTFTESCRDVPSLKGRQQFILDYELFSTPHVASVVFHSWMYAGGAHGNDSVQIMNLRLSDGAELGYRDIFANTEGLWVFLSDYVYEHLRPELWQIWRDTPQFTEGLEPVEDSFRHFAVTPQGITLFFPTYQIAPYSAGPQQCDVPLRALLRFVPRPGVWQ